MAILRNHAQLCNLQNIPPVLDIGGNCLTVVFLNKFAPLLPSPNSFSLAYLALRDPENSPPPWKWPSLHMPSWQLTVKFPIGIYLPAFAFHSVHRAFIFFNPHCSCSRSIIWPMKKMIHLQKYTPGLEKRSQYVVKVSQ